GRTDDAVEELVGFFVNTLVLRTDVSGDPTFREVVGRVREGALAAYAHQDVPFERLVEVLNPTRSLARHPLFQVMLSFNNIDDRAALDAIGELPGLTVDVGSLTHETARFDLLFGFNERMAEDGGAPVLSGRVEFATDLFDRKSIELMAGRLVRVLSGAVAGPDRPVGALEVLGEDERRDVLELWNDTARTVPKAGPAELFEEQVARTPDAVAVEFEGEALTYGELNARAGSLARLLADRGLGPGDFAGVMLPRSADLVVALLAVLKTGAAYLPIDPAYPADRIASMFEDAEPALTVTVEELAERLPDGAGRVLIDRDAWETLPEAGLPTTNRYAESPAYVIFTSGSTGRPKGVVVGQRALVNLLVGM
ncbi:AMP-binding protein, partial [Streptomyces sp. NPDC017529]|uniref:AMP-binding protein n=1 Tax=Streptomyces sp. NPDC017529 TaxID=3365000 RepID=UPI0037AA83C9